VETIINHPVQNLVDVGTLQNTMLCSPVNYHLIRNEYLGLITSLRKGFLSGDTVAVPWYTGVRDITPFGDLLRYGYELRRCA
jgi:hypothetical protein